MSACMSRFAYFFYFGRWENYFGRAGGKIILTGLVTTQQSHPVRALIRSGQIGRRSIAAINELDRFLEENYIHLFHRRVQEGSNSTGKCELGGRQEEKNSK